ncbi:DUF3560 domain-containing protein [Streptomyces sp. NPDC059443]|uniref:DUF3560 domain-containing protein n=1 Tax=unclassified Streptomyces TaxID=2593676 RepID=UPI00368CBA04
MEKLIREGILSRPFRASVVRVTEAGRCALEGRPVPVPVAVPEPVPVASQEIVPAVVMPVEHKPAEIVERTAAQWNGLPEPVEHAEGHQPRRTPYESTDVREAFSSDDGGLSFQLFRLPEGYGSPEMIEKHEKTRTEIAKAVAKRDKGAPEWKSFGKGHVKLKPRKAPKTDKTPADVLKMWADEGVTHEIACNHCGEFDCTCVRDVVSAVLADMGGPVVDAEAVESGRKRISGDIEITGAGFACTDQIALGEDVPETVAGDVVESVEDFPGVLEAGESAEHMGAGVWRVTYREGFTYELTPAQYHPGQYGAARLRSDGKFYGWNAIFDDQSIGPVVKWTRLESKTIAETRAFQAKYGHLHGRGYEDSVEVSFSLKLVTEELEPGRVWRVSRFGKSGVLVLQGWGYALLSETGDFPENPRRKYIDGKRRGYATWCVVGGLRDVPTSRLRPVAVDHSGEACVVFGHDAGQSCESGKRNKSFPRFVVEVTGPDGEIAGTVPMCARCWAGRAMADGDEFYNRRSASAAHLLAEGKGTWVDWQDRSEDLTGELISAALDSGADIPNVQRALYAEALEVGDLRAAKAARAAAVKAGANKQAADVVLERTLIERAQAHEELIVWAELHGVAWSAHISDLLAAKDAGEPEPEWVPPVKPGPAVHVEADVVTYDGEDDDQEQDEQQDNEGVSTVGRGSKAPRAKMVAPRVGDIVFSDKNAFPCVAELLGHRYVVRKLSGSFSAQHERSDGARLVFEGEDPKGGCRTGGVFFPNLPALKRAILADAVARGEAEPVAEEQSEPVVEPAQDLPRPLRLALAQEAAEEMCEECEQYEDECECYDPDREEQAPEPVESAAVKRFPELAQFLEQRPEGAPMVVLNLFSGPGGMVIGLRDVLRQQLGRDVEIINVDNDTDCVATLRAAGFLAIQADVTSLDPSDPVFREVRGLIVTPPCTDFADSGKRAGRLPENVDILCGAFDSARRAGGFIPFGDGHDVAPDFGVEVSYKEPNGLTWDEVRADLEGYSGQTGGLMLEVAVWSLGLQAAGAPLEWVAVEQSSRLPEEIRGEVIADYQLSGWGMAEWTVADAAEYGSPTQRVRALLVARRDGHSGVSMEAPGLRTGAATATGLPEGTPVYTRGVGKRSGGGNVVVVSDAKPYTAFTSRIRSVDVGEKGGRFTLAQIMRLIAVPETYPVQGSRTSVCQQVGDVVCPLVAAALLGAALGILWMPHLERFLAEQYPTVHGGDTPAPVCDKTMRTAHAIPGYDEPNRLNGVCTCGEVHWSREVDEPRVGRRRDLVDGILNEWGYQRSGDWEDNRAPVGALVADMEEISEQGLAGESVEDFALADKHEHAGVLARWESFPGKRYRVESRLTVECECGHVVWKRACNGVYDRQFVPMYLEAEGYGAGPWEQYEGADLGEFGKAENATAQLVRVEVFKGDVLRRMRKIKPLPGLLGTAPDHAPCGECGSVITKSRYWVGQDWELGAWCGWCARLPLDTDFEGLQDTAQAVDAKRGFCLVGQPADTAEISDQPPAGEQGAENPPADPGAASVAEQVAEVTEESADIVIRHTRADGTTLEGSSKGDGVWEAVKPRGWRYSRNVGIYIRGSRDRQADRWKINGAAEAVRALGYTVAVVIDEDTRRTFAEAEADRVERAEGRAERFGEYAGRAAQASDAAREVDRRIGERFWGGQPILVGHHSEGRARRDQERMHNAMRKSIAEGERAGYWANRAAASEAYERYRKNPGRTLRRIEKLEAERRGVLRERDGVDDKGRFADMWRRAPGEERAAELNRLMAEYDEELTYWAEVIAEAERRGFKVWGKADFVKGDYIRYRGTWYEVTRVNAKSATIPHIHASFDGGTVGAVGGCRVVTKAATEETRHKGSTWTANYNDGVTGRMSAVQMAAALAGEEVPTDPREVKPEPVDAVPAAEVERIAKHADQVAEFVEWAPGQAARQAVARLDADIERTAAEHGMTPEDLATAVTAWEGEGGYAEGVQTPRPVAGDPVAPVLPSTDRAYWEIGERVIFEGRHGSVKSAKNGKTLVMMDDGNGFFHEHIEPRDLVAERYVICGTPVTLTVPSKPEPLELPEAPVSEALESYVVPEVPALVVCGGLMMPKPYVRPAHYADDDYVLALPKAPRPAYASEPDYLLAPPIVDVFAELRREVEELRQDVEDWGGLAAATVVANAETIVRELASELRLLEVEALRREARELREELGWGPVRWAAIETPRGRRWAMAASVAGTVAGLGAALGQVVPPRA